MLFSIFWYFRKYDIFNPARDVISALKFAIQEPSERAVQAAVKAGDLKQYTRPDGRRPATKNIHERKYQGNVNNYIRKNGCFFWLYHLLRLKTNDDAGQEMKAMDAPVDQLGFSATAVLSASTHSNDALYDVITQNT